MYIGIADEAGNFSNRGRLPTSVAIAKDVNLQGGHTSWLQAASGRNRTTWKSLGVDYVQQCPSCGWNDDDDNDVYGI